MSTKEVVYPFPVADGLRLVVSDFVDGDSGEHLEGITVETEEEVGQQRFDLVQAKPTWSRLQFDVNFSAEPERIAEVLPPGGDIRSDAIALVSITCSSTKYRRGVKLQSADDHSWKGTLELSRDDVLGAVELTPSVVRSRPADASGEYADYAGALLASGPAVQLIVDRLARRFDGNMEYVWENFAASGNQWRSQRKDDVFHLEPADVPILYLNLRWGFLKPILEFEGKSGASAAMRDMAAAAIAQGAWTELYAIAVASIQKDGDEYLVGGESWRKDLVKLVLRDLYPDTAEDERLARAREDLNEPVAAGMLMAKLGAMAQTRSSMGKLMDRAVKEIESVANVALEPR